MGFYEKNMYCLKEKHEGLYAKLMGSLKDADRAYPNDIADAYTAETKETELSVTIGIGENIYRLNSAYKPSAEAERWGSQFSFGNADRIITMFGMGNGIFVRQLLPKMSDGTTLILYEPSLKLFCFILENFDITDILSDRRVILLIEDIDRLDFREALIRYVDFYRLETLLVTFHPQYDRAFSKAYGIYQRTLADNRERLYVNKNTLARFKSRSVRNTLTNMHIMEEANLTCELQKLIPKDVPVIIVSAGPSLDRNIEQLREAKGRCIILAVDTAVKYLLRRDIEPDVTIVVEPEKPVEHYADIRSLKIPLICDIEANSEIISRHTGRKIIYNCHGFLKKLLEAMGKKTGSDIGSGGSVATAAFALCYQLELKTIIMTGQDLAYSGETTHAGGIESKGINNNIGYELIEGIDGNEVRTRSDWIGYLRWFENTIEVIRDLKKDITVIDATEGGARIHGTEVMRLKDAIDRYCLIPYNFGEALNGTVPYLNSREYSALRDKLSECRAELPLMAERAEQAAELCKSVICSYDSCETDNQNRQKTLIGALRRQIENSPVYQMVNDYAVADIAEAVQELERDTADKREREINNYMQQQLAFEVIPKACHDILEYDFGLD